jgi:hypothetical protein
MTDQLPRLYSEPEAAAYLGVEPRTLARIRKAGLIGFIQVADRRYRYLDEHLVQYVLSRITEPAIRQYRQRARARARLAAAKPLPPASAVPHVAHLLFGHRDLG